LLLKRPLNQQEIDKFWSNVDRSNTDPDACWEWTGYRMKFGYGFFQMRKVSNTPLLAHRVAWTLLNGKPIPEGKHVLHACDNPPCCRHLFLGDQRSNNDDRDRKGRVASGDRNGSRTHPERVPRGERQGTSKLTREQVREIRERCKKRGDGTKLAREFGISQQHVSVLVNKKQWRFLDAPHRIH